MNEKLINTKQLIEWLSINKNTANNWRRKGLPYKQFGKKIMYVPDEVCEWIKTHNTRKDVPHDDDFFIESNKSITLLKNVLKDSTKDEYLKRNIQKESNNKELIKNMSNDQYKSILKSGSIKIQQDIRAAEIARTCEEYRMRLIVEISGWFNPSASADDLSINGEVAINHMEKFLDKLAGIIIKNTGIRPESQPTDEDIQELLKISRE